MPICQGPHSILARTCMRGPKGTRSGWPGLRVMWHPRKGRLRMGLVLVTPRLGGVWRSRVKVEWDAGALWVVSREGLIQLKLIRDSGRDRDDIQRLESSYKRVDGS